MSYRGHSKGNYGLRKVQRVHNRRTTRAKRIDEGLRAPTAKTPEQWLQQPNRYDYLDVDTPNDKASKAKQKRRLEEIRSFEDAHSPSRHGNVRQRLNIHKVLGVTH